jgi:ribose transport system substrate-binding protein
MRRQRTMTGHRRLIAMLVALGVAMLAITGCGSSSKSSSSSGGGSGSSATQTSGGATSTSGGGTSTSSGGSSSGGSSPSALGAKVDKLAAVPNFSQYAANYGGKVDGSKLKGKKIMIIPGSSQLAACVEIAQASAALANALGAQTKIFANDGTPSQHNSAIQEAIQGGYNAIQLECDFDPTTVAPAIAQAQAKGIKVVAYGATQEETTKSKIDGDTVDPYTLDGEAAAWQAISQAGGKPFDAIAVTSNEAPATAQLQQGITSQLKKYCPDCKLTNVNVPVPNWTNDISTTLSSALLRDPKATVVFPDYAGMLTYILQGIQSAHRTGNIKTYLAFGGGTPFIKLQTAEPGKSIIQSDIGGYPPWTGYLLLLQTARVLNGMPPIPLAKAIGPDRIATPQNAVNVLTTGGWGTSWVNGFRKLLGLPALSGSALTSASTLNGAMTAKP